MNCTPDKSTFLTKAKRGTLVPVWRELLADQETPVSAYERLRRHFAGAPTFLLESVEGGEHIARYSFLGGAPRCLFTELRAPRGAGIRRRAPRGEGGRGRAGCVARSDGEATSRCPIPPCPASLAARWVSSATTRWLSSSRACRCPRPGLDWPDLVLGMTDTILIFDHTPPHHEGGGQRPY
jgi:anthranilate synthase component 1